MNDQRESVLAHHHAAAAMWGQGGRHYDKISFAISDALAHAAQRLNPRVGERILDIATGTGWSARNAARMGARVTAADISEELLAAGRALSAHVDPPIDFRLADAEALPFEDCAFDGVISTFGIMFALDQARAASELARVCRKGGRAVLATWAADGAVARFFGVLGAYSEAPPPPSSPLAWGNPDHVTQLLGRDFDLIFEPGVNDAYHASTEDIWNYYLQGFGPIRQLASSLDPSRLAAMKRDVDEYHSHYSVPAGLHVKREYLVIIGHRR